MSGRRTAALYDHTKSMAVAKARDEGSLKAATKNDTSGETALSIAGNRPFVGVNGTLDAL